VQTVSEQDLDYPRLVQQALLGVVRQALRVTAERGLPGEHHFYLSFRTDAPGVVVPRRLRKRYPDEMSVVLQHEFFELDVNEESFAVSLKFGGKLERIEVPFAALTAFTDPSVSFGLQFPRALDEGAAEPTAPPAEAATPRAGAEVFQFPREPVRQEPSGDS
jgi:hypothetical protein